MLYLKRATDIMPVDVVGEQLVLNLVSIPSVLGGFVDLLLEFVAERPADPALHVGAQILEEYLGKHTGGVSSPP